MAQLSLQAFKRNRLPLPFLFKRFSKHLPLFFAEVRILELFTEAVQLPINFKDFAFYHPHFIKDLLFHRFGHSYHTDPVI